MRAGTSRAWSSVPSQLRLPSSAVRVVVALRIAGAAFRLVHQPEGLRRRRMRNVGVGGLIGIADRRPDHPAIGVDLVADIVGAVVGFGQEAAELLLRIVDQHRQQDFALVGGEDRLVVGDEFGAEAEAEQQQEYPERPVAAPVGLEILPAALVDRRQPAGARRDESRIGGDDIRHQTSLRSKSMRGSTQV